MNFDFNQTSSAPPGQPEFCNSETEGFDIGHAEMCPDVRSQLAENYGELDSGPTIRFNIVKHPERVLVKQYGMRDGLVHKDMSRSGRIPPGCTVSTITTSLRDYVGMAHDGGHRQYVLPSNTLFGDQTPLRVKGQPGGVDRSAKTMKFVAGQPALLTLDHDPNPLSPTTLDDPSALHRILGKLFPDAFAGAAFASYFSSSSFIFLPDDTPYSGVKGFHSAFAVRDAEDIPRFGVALFKRLFLHGYGYMHITQDGRLLPRTLFDAKVLEPQQPLFAGGASCNDGLSQRRPRPMFQGGGYLRTESLKSLTSEEEERYLRLEKAARLAVAAQAKAVRLAYQKQAVAKLVDRGLSMERARRTVESRVGGDLVGDDELMFADYGVVRVAEVLANPERFDECSLHDPVEPDYGGPGTAMFFANEETGDPVIFSHAHGGRSFFVRHDEESLKARLASLSSSEVAASWVRLLVGSRLADDAAARILQVVRQQTGTPMPDLRKALGHAKRAEAGDGHAAPDPALVVARRLLEEKYDGGTHLLMTEGGGFWNYMGTHWRPLAKPVLLGQLQDACESCWGWIVNAFEFQKKSAPGLAPFVSSAMAVLERLVVKPGDPLRLASERPSVINMLNGELWLEAQGPELRPHSPVSYLTSCSAIVHDPDATAPGFLLALQGLLSLPGGVPMADQDEMVRHVIEMFGYAIQTRRELKVFYLITGPGDNGKTRLTKLLTLVVGQDAIVFDRMGGIDEDRSRFATSKLVGKQILIDDDAEHEYLLPDGLLKKISEAKPMTAEPKFQGAFTFVAAVLPIILSNSWPRTRDLSRGMRTRAQVIYLPRQFKRPDECPPDDPDIQRPEVWDSVYADELPGVVNLLVEGFYRLKRRGSFAQPPSAVEAFETWLGEANVVSRFLRECCEKTTGDAAMSPGPTTSLLYKAFGTWASDNDVQAVHRPQKNKFKSRIEELGYRVAHCNKGTAVYGLRLKPEWVSDVVRRNLWLGPDDEVSADDLF